jgi:cyclophilin family peptidyl-prolyl cis-trans isomerase
MVRSTACALVVSCACSSGGAGGAYGGAAGESGSTGGAAGESGSTGGAAGESGSAGGAGLDAGPDAVAGKPVVELVTSMGTMAIELEPERMPITTANFLSYVDEGFYDGTIFHRVVLGFVIQGGGYSPGLAPKATKPPIVLEIDPELKHTYGAISMARTDVKDSATSQFFVVNAPGGVSYLDGEYAAFGMMIEGSAVLGSISSVPTTTQSGFTNVPVQEVVVISAKRR